jgi:hypothetical protein
MGRCRGWELGSRSGCEKSPFPAVFNFCFLIFDLSVDGIVLETGGEPWASDVGQLVPTVPRVGGRAAGVDERGEVAVVVIGGALGAQRCGVTLRKLQRPLFLYWGLG